MNHKINYRINSLIIIVLSVMFIFCGCSSTPVVRKTTIKDTDIAYISLFTFDGKSESTMGLMNLGHSFLSLENVSSEPIKIANVSIDPGKTIAIGTWSIKAHFGVWYNVESNYIKDYNKYDGRLSITTGIGSEDIEKVSDFILSHDYWNPLQNCSYFALNLWNEIAEDGEKLDSMAIFSPSAIANQIKTFESYDVNKEIITDSKFHYFDNDTPVYYELEDNYASV